jgi:quercetin dioxygenase-like cupin family protein
MRIGANQLARSAAIRPSELLRIPMLTFDLTAEIERLRKGMLGRATELKALVKRADFRSVLIVLKPEARLHEHKAAGRISVQTVACHIRMHGGSQLFILPAGHSLALEHVLPHNVESSENSAFLLTICLSDDVEER